MVTIEELTGEQWVSPTKAARMLHLSLGRVSQLTASGELISLATPIGRLVWRESLLHELERRAEKGK